MHAMHVDGQPLACALLTYLKELLHHRLDFSFYSSALKVLFKLDDGVTGGSHSSGPSLRLMGSKSLGSGRDYCAPVQPKLKDARMRVLR